LSINFSDVMNRDTFSEVSSVIQWEVELVILVAVKTNQVPAQLLRLMQTFPILLLKVLVKVRKFKFE
jgi:hypothetical protein